MALPSYPWRVAKHKLRLLCVEHAFLGTTSMYTAVFLTISDKRLQRHARLLIRMIVMQVNALEVRMAKHLRNWIPPRNISSWSSAYHFSHIRKWVVDCTVLFPSQRTQRRRSIQLRGRNSWFHWSSRHSLPQVPSPAGFQSQCQQARAALLDAKRWRPWSVRPHCSSVWRVAVGHIRSQCRHFHLHSQCRKVRKRNHHWPASYLANDDCLQDWWVKHDPSSEGTADLGLSHCRQLSNHLPQVPVSYKTNCRVGTTK